MEAKFKEPKNTAVFTTQNIIDNIQPITYVQHDAADGSWLFLDVKSLSDTETKSTIISLEKIVSIDETLLSLADLPLGFCATRQDINDFWSIQKIDNGNIQKENSNIRMKPASKKQKSIDKIKAFFSIFF